MIEGVWCRSVFFIFYLVWGGDGDGGRLTGRGRVERRGVRWVFSSLGQSRVSGVCLNGRLFFGLRGGLQARFVGWFVM